MSKNFRYNATFSDKFWCWDKQAAEKQVSFRVWAKIKYLAVTY